MSYNRTTVTCTDNGNTVGADILNKTERLLRVVLDYSEFTLTLHKDTPHKPYYIGNLHGMEFTSTGENE